MIALILAATLAASPIQVTNGRIHVIAMGDSITQGPGNSVTPWIRKVGQLREPTLACRNAGRATLMTPAIASLWTSRFATLRQWDYVVLLSGVNDLRNGYLAATVWTSQKGIVDDALARGSKVILLRVTPWGTWPDWTAAKQIQSDELWVTQQAYCAADPTRIQCLDTHPVLKDPSNPNNLLPAYSLDGLHFNQGGNDALATAVSPLIQ